MLRIILLLIHDDAYWTLNNRIFKAIPIKCFVSHRPTSRESREGEGSVGRSVKKAENNWVGRAMGNKTFYGDGLSDLELNVGELWIHCFCESWDNIWVLNLSLLSDRALIRLTWFWLFAVNRNWAFRDQCFFPRPEQAILLLTSQAVLIDFNSPSHRWKMLGPSDHL